MPKDTDLKRKIQETPMCDTHEHLFRHQAFRSERLDILGALFGNYVSADLVVGGRRTRGSGQSDSSKRKSHFRKVSSN